MKLFKISFDKEACVGNFACMAADPRNWKNAPYDNRKTDLAGGKFNKETQRFEKIVQEGDFDPAAEPACPVAAIKITEVSESEAAEWREKIAAQSQKPTAQQAASA